jgi:hypothetical protein
MTPVVRWTGRLRPQVPTRRPVPPRPRAPVMPHLGWHELADAIGVPHLGPTCDGDEHQE